MKAKVISKANFSGTSEKTGEDYNLNIVYAIRVVNGVEGHATEQLALDAVIYPLFSIQIGKTYDVDRDSRGFVIGFELVG